MILTKDNIWQHPIILAKRSQSIYATSRKELSAPLICAWWVKQCASMIVKKNLICIIIIFIIIFIIIIIFQILLATRAPRGSHQN